MTFWESRLVFALAQKALVPWTAHKGVPHLSNTPKGEDWFQAVLPRGVGDPCSSARDVQPLSASRDPVQPRSKLMHNRGNPAETPGIAPWLPGTAWPRLQHRLPPLALQLKDYGLQNGLWLKICRGASVSGRRSNPCALRVRNLG